jgi:5-methylcytosine-specific restriction endonuclease McrA
MKKKVNKKLPSLSKMKREADRIFSLYIRAKYPKICYTCLATGKTLQCGHFISRSYLATRWNENNARPQCVGCNIWGRGKPLDFEEHLKSEIGPEEVEQLKLQRKLLIKPTRFFYETLIANYQEKLKQYG